MSTKVCLPGGTREAVMDLFWYAVAVYLFFEFARGCQYGYREEGILRRVRALLRAKLVHDGEAVGDAHASPCSAAVENVIEGSYRLGRD